jgi:myo-inositol 2-dehydrogenase / D-chiro-inositol 1-dehydrogenase
MSFDQNGPTDGPSRRDFIRTTTAATIGISLAPMIPGAYAAGTDAIRIGLIGCGGRGTGAVLNAFEGAAGVTLVAMGDAFADRLDESLKNIQKNHGDQVDVPANRRFTGLDAYKGVLATDANYIILATPPGFRPMHLEAAIAAGKNIFTEKPVAVDGPGIRKVLALYEEANAKGLGIAAGTQRRHQTGYIETLKRIQDGAIGRIVAARCAWNQGSLWKKDRQPAWTDVEWQMRNWLYFTWLSGDHIVEQHVHNIDVVNWAMGTHPVAAHGMGGRQVRTGPEYGHIFDHFSIDYEYPGGVRVHSQCRQIQGCEGDVSEALVGEKGTCQVDKYAIAGAQAWKFDGKDSAPYVQEHTDFIASLRAGKPLNELKNVAESTMTAIMGRMSAYTGLAVSWDEALNSKESLMPEALRFGPMEVPPVAMPGRTKLT